MPNNSPTQYGPPHSDRPSFSDGPWANAWQPVWESAPSGGQPAERAQSEGDSAQADGDD